MAPLSRKVLPYGAPAAVFACGVAFLLAGGPAGPAGTLIVLSLGGAIWGANAVAPSCGRRGRDRTHSGRRCEAVQQRHAAESRRTLSRPR